MSVDASHRFNNHLRYRDAADPANVQFTPGTVLALTHGRAEVLF